MIIEPSHELEGAVGTMACQVAGLVEAGAGVAGERMGNKPLSGQLRLVEVAAADSGATNVEFPGYPDRYRLQVGVEYIGFDVVDRSSDRRRATVSVRCLAERRLKSPPRRTPTGRNC